ESARSTEVVGECVDLLPDHRGTAVGFVDDQEPAPAVGGGILEGRVDHESRHAEAVGHRQAETVTDQSEELQGIESGGHTDTHGSPAGRKAIDEPTGEPGLAGAGLARNQDRAGPAVSESGSERLQRPSTTGDGTVGPIV